MSFACSDDGTADSGTAEGTETGTGETTDSMSGSETADGTGDGDGDGDSAEGDGDGDTMGDGDGDTMGDGDGDTMGDGDGDGGPGALPGDMVDLGDYQIGAVEVTVGEYAAFLDENLGFDGLPPECAWKDDYTPDNWMDQVDGGPDYPVRRVDWCDAWAYCDSAGQRLCGEVGGGPAQLADHDNPLNNEWFKACSNDGLVLYPYGNLYDGGACNGVDFGLGAPSIVGSILSCEGGKPGIYDMSGNVFEWTNACAAEMVPDETQECRRRGGSLFSAENILDCSIDSVRERNYRGNNTGLRCCL